MHSITQKVVNKYAIKSFVLSNYIQKNSSTKIIHMIANIQLQSYQKFHYKLISTVMERKLKIFLHLKHEPIAESSLKYTNTRNDEFLLYPEISRVVTE